MTMGWYRGHYVPICDVCKGAECRCEACVSGAWDLQRSVVVAGEMTAWDLERMHAAWRDGMWRVELSHFIEWAKKDRATR